MFEPLKDIVGGHAENLQSVLGSILDRLDTIAQNTIAQVEFNEFLTKNNKGIAGAAKTTDVEFCPREGYSWRISRQAVTQSKGGVCAVYVGSIAPENLVDVVEGGIAAGRPKYFVPRGQNLIFHFYEQEEKQRCTVNIQIEQFIPVTKVRQPDRGISNEGVTQTRVPQPPSPIPSEDPQIPV